MPLSFKDFFLIILNTNARRENINRPFAGNTVPLFAKNNLASNQHCWVIFERSSLLEKRLSSSSFDSKRAKEA